MARPASARAPSAPRGSRRGALRRLHGLGRTAPHPAPPGSGRRGERENVGRATAPGEPRKGGRAPAGGGRAALRTGAGRGGAARSLRSAPDRGPPRGDRGGGGGGCARGRGPGEDGERPPRAERRRRARGTSAAGGGQPSPAGSHAAPRPRAADGALSRERGSLGGAGRLSAPSRSAGPLPAGSRVPRRTAEPASPRGRSRLLAASKRGRHGAAPCGGSSGGGLRAAALPGSALVTAARRWLRARRNFRGKRTEAKQSIPAAYRTVPYN
eukprot:XP_025007076.1 uncharacterized protein LOC112532562 [Gallus gallus]